MELVPLVLQTQEAEAQAAELPQPMLLGVQVDQESSLFAISAELKKQQAAQSYRQAVITITPLHLAALLQLIKD
jgi:hypothetical protein